MGIKDLLRALQMATDLGSIDSYRGSRIAIDASGWLHKGLYSAAEDFVDSGFRDAQLYVDFIVSRARNFRNCGVEPVLVFDGKRNNLKSETNSKREEMRTSNMQQGRRLMESMRATSDGACRQKLRMEAIACFQRGMAVTHEMELYTIAALRKLGILVIVSPYEADAQLAYLCHIGYCQAILTEDSDVLVYAAICGRSFDVLYKFDKGGAVQRINLQSAGVFSDDEGADADFSPRLSQLSQNTMSSLSSSTKSNNSNNDEGQVRGGSEKNFLAQLQTFRGTKGRRMFVQMCVLAGCDYCESIHGVGLQTALQAVLRYKDCRDDDRLKRVCTHFKTSGKNVIDTYLLRVQRAEALFHYHPVYNPYTKDVVPFIPHNFLDPHPSHHPHHSDIAVQEVDEDEDVQIILPTTSSRVGRSGSSSSGSSSGNIKSLLTSQEIIISSSRSSSSSSIGPAIGEVAILQLGSAAELLRNAPAGVTIADICEGRVSFKTFEDITPRFPWEDQRIAQAGNKGGYGGMWATRRGLIQALSLEAGRSSKSKSLIFHPANQAGHGGGGGGGAAAAGQPPYGSAIFKKNHHPAAITFHSQRFQPNQQQQRGSSNRVSSGAGAASSAVTGVSSLKTGGFFTIISSQQQSQQNNLGPTASGRFGSSNSRQKPPIVVRSAREVYGAMPPPKFHPAKSANPIIDVSGDDNDDYLNHLSKVAANADASSHHRFNHHPPGEHQTHSHSPSASVSSLSSSSSPSSPMIQEGGEYADVLRSGMDPTADSTHRTLTPTLPLPLSQSSPSSSPSSPSPSSSSQYHCGSDGPQPTEPAGRVHKPLGDPQSSGPEHGRKPLGDLSNTLGSDSSHTSLQWVNYQRAKLPSTTTLNPFAGHTSVSPSLSGSSALTESSVASGSSDAYHASLVTPSSDDSSDTYIDLSEDSSSILGITKMMTTPQMSGTERLFASASTDHPICDTSSSTTSSSSPTVGDISVSVTEQGHKHVSLVGPKNTPPPDLSAHVPTGSLGQMMMATQAPQHKKHQQILSSSYLSPEIPYAVSTAAAVATRPALVTPSSSTSTAAAAAAVAVAVVAGSSTTAGQGQKRKFDAVAINTTGGAVAGKGSGTMKNKKAKTTSTIMVASIKSFFAPKQQQQQQ